MSREYFHSIISSEQNTTYTVLEFVHSLGVEKILNRNTQNANMLMMRIHFGEYEVIFIFS